MSEDLKEWQTFVKMEPHKQTSVALSRDSKWFILMKL